MKDKEKQIEEIAKDYYGYSIDLEEDCKFVAEEMYNKGHRKLTEDNIVLSRGEYDEFLRQNFIIDELKDCVKLASKETAEKIYKQLQEHGTTYVKKWIKEQFGVEIKE